MSVPQHIVALLEDYLDGRLDEPGREVVSSWVRQSAEHAAELAAWFATEVELLEASRLVDMRDVFEGLHFSAGPRPRASASRMPSRAWRPMKAIAALAAAVLAVLAAAQLWYQPGNIARERDKIANATVAKTNAPIPSPAMLGRLAKCVWTSSEPPRVGEELAAGTTLDLKSGLAQLVFESGAELVLKGPCRLRIDNTMLCNLEYGDVSAEVPPRAAGFTIRGPSAEVIDLGTRFGFSVGAAGNSEVHVFQGEVISRQLDERGAVVGKEIRLKKNQAVLFPGAKKQAQRLAANEAKFALTVRPLWRKEQIEPLAVDRNLALWLRAAHGVQKDPRGRVVAWQDLAFGPNHFANDAYQPNAKARPRFVAEALGGRPAIRFDGAATFMTTTPLTTTDDQTIVVAFQYLPSGEGKSSAGQIINYNGPPSRFLPDIYSPGVLQLGEKIDVWNGAVDSISAKAFVGRDSYGADVSAGIVVSESIGKLQTRVVAYTYNNTENTATLFVDGEPVASSSAPTSVAVTSRKVIGKHGIFNQWYFHGDVGELIIFNAALSAAEIKKLSGQLLEYYHVGRAAPSL